MTNTFPPIGDTDAEKSTLFRIELILKTFCDGTLYSVTAEKRLREIIAEAAQNSGSNDIVRKAAEDVIQVMEVCAEKRLRTPQTRWEFLQTRIRTPSWER